MMNLKKSRKSMIALSVIAALIICSIATMYAFASGTDDPAEEAYDFLYDIIEDADIAEAAEQEAARSILYSVTKVGEWGDLDSEEFIGLLTYDEFAAWFTRIMEDFKQKWPDGVFGSDKTGPIPVSEEGSIERHVERITAEIADGINGGYNTGVGLGFTDAGTFVVTGVQQ
jgi:hypothetical protein